MLQVSLDLHTLLDGENKTKVVTKEVMYVYLPWHKSRWMTGKSYILVQVNYAVSSH